MFLKSISSNKKIYIVTIILAFFTQATGNLVVVMYSPSILAAAGITGRTALLTATVIIGVWNLACTFVPFFTTDRLGRVVLLVVGYGLMALGALLLAFGVVFSMQRKYLLSISGIAISLLGYEVGPGSIFFVVISEIFPFHVRSMSISLVMTVFLVGSVFISFAYLPLAEAIGELPIFIALTVFSVFIALVVFFFLPETKGRVLGNESQNENENENRNKNEKENEIENKRSQETIGKTVAVDVGGLGVAGTDIDIEIEVDVDTDIGTNVDENADHQDPVVTDTNATDTSARGTNITSVGTGTGEGVIDVHERVGDEEQCLNADSVSPVI